MKIKKLANYRPVALVALGVFLGRGAQADTVLDFDADAGLCIPPQVNNPNAPPGITNFGSFATASTPGVTVTGFGTPNIGLGWSTGDTRWEYYNDGGVVWSAVQLQDSFVGSTERLTFAPDNPSAAVVIKSFNFHGYYNSTERFTYNVSVVTGATVVSGPTRFTFLSDGTKNHPANINYTGAPGQTLKLKLERVASTLAAGEVEGDPYDIAVDDIRFAQTPETIFPAGPQVITVTPVDDSTGVPAVLHPYLASITNGANTLVADSIKLKIDASLISPAPTITSSGGLTDVSHPGTELLSSGTHVYSLTYDDNLGGHYTNETAFSSIYSTLPPDYALPPGSGALTGFTFLTVTAPQDTTNVLASSIARAVAQLNGTLIDTSTGLPYTNSGTLGPNADGSYDIDTVLNFNGDGIDEGNFPNDQIFPGLPPIPCLWFSTEALLFLDLPAGYYRFGVNSDDGFQVNALPPLGASGSPIVLGSFDNARGAADTLFDVQATTSGIYPFQVIYFQSTGKSAEEFFSVTNLATGDKILVNDPAYPNSVKSYRVIAPRLTSIVTSGANAVLNWAYGAPPFQLQVKTNLTDAQWSNIGSTTSNRTANVQIQPGTRFFRVFGQ